MSKTPAFARIAITLPPRVLAAADKRAAALDRSRSWVIAEAIRRYTNEPGDDPSVIGAAPAGLGESRLRQLRADLELSPEARVREAEDTARTTAGRRRSRRQSIVTFETYEDYLAFKRVQDAGG